MNADTSVNGSCVNNLDSTGSCPVGWHIPSLEEWGRFVSLLGGVDRAGMLAKSDTIWRNLLDQSARGRDSVGFAALPAGYAVNDLYISFGTETGFWSRTDTTSSEYNSCTNSWALVLNADSKTARFMQLARTTGLSVRCVKNHP